LALCLIAGATRAAAPDAPPSAAERAEIAKAEALLKSLHPTHGDIKLPGADATLHLGDRYYFLGPADAKRVLVEGWGNPPDAADGVLGLVFPAGASPLSDAEAKTTDYGKLLESMRSNEDQVNDERKKQNIPAIHLVGWAQAPVYDPAHHSLIWARDIQFADQKIDTLNYDVRELGRRGVLSLNIVYRMPDLASVRTAATDLGAVTGFDPGARYTDYQNGVDKRAAYGVAGLVAAGAGVALAQKAGLLALLLLFLKKGFVVIIAGGAALFARIKAAFRKKTV
jgi:uncharacterized membrane-anchored protein